MIKVGRMYEKNAQYVGRGSPLGNPFIMRDESDEERNRVCDQYEEHFNKYKDVGYIAKELKRLHELSKKGGSNTRLLL